MVAEIYMTAKKSQVKSHTCSLSEAPPPPLRPSRYPSSLRRPLFCLMFERAFIPQILCALMNNAWASVANPHPPHTALSNTHKHSASYLLCTLHPQMGWPRSFPPWMQDNWICRSVVFCCPDRSVYRNKRPKKKKTHTHTQAHPHTHKLIEVWCVCVYMCVHINPLGLQRLLL